jgi:hypothetical protein
MLTGRPSHSRRSVKPSLRDFACRNLASRYTQYAPLVLKTQQTYCGFFKIFLISCDGVATYDSSQRTGFNSPTTNA